MKRALIVGIDHYPEAPLKGCIRDAELMHRLLERDEDGTPNFSCKLLLSSQTRINAPRLYQEIETLLMNPADTAVFFYAGHGTENLLDGYLVTQDARRYDEGLSFSNLIRLANASRCREVVIITDACHSGRLGSTNGAPELNLREGVAILSATLSYQFAKEKNGQGIFTGTLAEALSGGAADILGNVSLAAIYSYVDQLLGPWEQRPMFKAHLSRMISLRRCKPRVPHQELRTLHDLFPSAEASLRLSPEYEPSAMPHNAEKEAVFAQLQRFRSQDLLVPEGFAHLYEVAMNSGTCRLSARGRYIWKLVEKGLL